MPRNPIQTLGAPAAIGTYSQAVKINGTVYLSGQIPLLPDTGDLVASDMRLQITQALTNLAAVTEAAGGSLNDVVKLGVYLTDLAHFPLVNEVMTAFFTPPYPARAVVGVNALPKGAGVEVDAVMVLDAAGVGRAPTLA